MHTEQQDPYEHVSQPSQPTRPPDSLYNWHCWGRRWYHRLRRRIGRSARMHGSLAFEGDGLERIPYTPTGCTRHIYVVDHVQHWPSFPRRPVSFGLLCVRTADLTSQALLVEAFAWIARLLMAKRIEVDIGVGLPQAKAQRQ